MWACGKPIWTVTGLRLEQEVNEKVAVHGHPNDDQDWGPGKDLAGERAQPRRLEEEGFRIAAVVDPALAEVWAFVFGQRFEPDQLAEHLGWLLRMAYLRGYEDGLCEPERGALFSRLGLSVPARRSRSGCPSGRRTT